MPASTPRPPAPPPRAIAPMKAVLAADLPPDPAGWAYEVKWDGMRAVGFVEGGSLRLQTTNLLDATGRFPELADLGPALAHHSAVVDGEVVTLGPRGVPDFGLLQPRMQARSTQVAREGASRQPAAYVLFDLLELDGTSTTHLPYEDRRALLERLVPPGPRWQVGPRHGDGAALLEAARSLGYEGVVAKRLGSRYEPGRRSPAWQKVKVHLGQELVVGGWLPGEGARQASFGALLVGYHEPAGGPLRYAGRVGTGFDHAELGRWSRLLAELAVPTCPFDPPPPPAVVAHATWVRPEAVVEVRFGGWTADGVLRHPAYRGQRFDKDAAAVVREPVGG